MGVDDERPALLGRRRWAESSSSSAKACGRSGAARLPSLASIVTVCVTVLLLGVLIPVLQTTNGKTNEVRDQVGLRIFLNDVNGQQAPADQSTPSRRSSRRSRTSSRSQFVDKNQALSILSDRLKAENREDITPQLPGTHNPLPASFNVTPDDLSNLPAVRNADHPARGERPADADQPADLGHRRLAR